MSTVEPCQGGSRFGPCKNPGKFTAVLRTWQGKPLDPDAGEVPVCGIHRNEHERARRRGEQAEARRQADRERRDRVTVANNIAMMLTDAVRAQSGFTVGFEVSYDGRTLSLDVESADKIRRWLS